MIRRPSLFHRDSANALLVGLSGECAITTKQITQKFIFFNNMNKDEVIRKTMTPVNPVHQPRNPAQHFSIRSNCK
jgi:hypothetical protein